VSLLVEFSVQLAHGDGFGVHDVGVDRHEGLAAGLGLALQCSHGSFQHLVTLKNFLKLLHDERVNFEHVGI
jgi:hypothetical protein